MFWCLTKCHFTAVDLLQKYMHFLILNKMIELRGYKIKHQSDNVTNQTECSMLNRYLGWIRGGEGFVKFYKTLTNTLPPVKRHDHI